MKTKNENIRRALVIVDMQNDFITGSLANKDAAAIIPEIIKEIKTGDYARVICTQDTHSRDYLKSSEGQKLPIVHCIKHTPGWCMQEDIFNAVEEVPERAYLYKDNFGYKFWYCYDYLERAKIQEIVLVGTCTDICVVTNALLLKTYFPEKRIVVKSNLCAGTTPENHRMALETMRNCQIEVE